MNIFLSFDLCIAPRIFNLFAEALYWIFEIFEEWNVTHYLDDFLFIFSSDIDTTQLSAEFDHILAEFDLSKAIEKDADDYVIIHLGFEFDSIKMQVSLSSNKKLHTLDAINSLLSTSIISFQSLESILDFLSHYCQIISFEYLFLRQFFSLLCYYNAWCHFRKIRIPRLVKDDLHWW